MMRRMGCSFSSPAGLAEASAVRCSVFANCTIRASVRNAQVFEKKRAVDERTSSTTTRSFSLSVVPVAVMSTMRSAMPVRGASSMLPCSFTISTCVPVFA